MSADEKPKRRRIDRMTLPKAIKTFASYPSPWVLAVGALVTWAIRIALGAWSLWDAAILIGFVAAWPFVEWVIHVFVLHFRPLEVGGRTVDLHLAKKHRDHHRDPNDLTNVFIPLRSLLITVAAALPIAWLVTPTAELMVIALAGLFSMGLIYEWCHFLIHTNYRAKTSLYKRIWRHHRLHHFKHEKNWFGVSTTLGDRVLGTAPDFREIETSPNCRDLGIDENTLE